MRAPTAAELMTHPTGRQALEEAWVDSLAEDPIHRHEEGGWIYMSIPSGEILIRRAPSGIQSEIHPDSPPFIADAVIIGVFHTYPNPTAEGWDSGPSEADRRADERDGVPDLIRADNGIHLSGPKSRRGGLEGGPGFPP